MKQKVEPKTRHDAITATDPQRGLVSNILVAGVGNVFLGDDAFGSVVTRKLQQHGLPAQVFVKDFGICGFDLANALHDAYDAVILVNSVARGERPGTLFVVEPNLEELRSARKQDLLTESHGVNHKVLELLRQIEADAFKQLLVVGCEPAATDHRLGPAGLSAPVEAAVTDAVEIIECLVTGMLEHSGANPGD